MEMFSVSDLARSLFSPFKQTYAGESKGSINVRFRAFLDRTFSRVFGFFIRSMLIFSGLVSGLVAFVTGVVFLLLWGLIPASPLIAIVLMGVGL